MCRISAVYTDWGENRIYKAFFLLHCFHTRRRRWEDNDMSRRERFEATVHGRPVDRVIL